MAAFFRKYWRNFFILFTLLSDAFAILASAWVAIIVRQMIPGTPQLNDSTLLQSTLIFGGILLSIGLMNGLYRSAFHSNLRLEFLIAGKCYLQSILIIFSLLYLLGVPFPRRFTLLFMITLPVMFAASRYLLLKINLLAQRWHFGIHHVLIIGYEAGDEELFRRFRKFPELGYNIKGVVSSEKIFMRKSRKPIRRQTMPDEHLLKDFVPAYSLSELESVIVKEHIDRAFIPSLDFISNGHAQLIKVCKKNHIKLKILSKESEDLLRFSQVRDIAGITLFAPPRITIDRMTAVIKRGLDLLIGSVAFIMVFPLLSAVALAIVLEDGGSIVFKQRRALVKGGRQFWFYKFRSMVKGAELKQQDLYRHNKTTGGLFLMEEDPRLTRVGRFIRKYSIDELPQIWNVLKGDMSLVGPRPLSIADLQNLDPENELSGLYKLRGQSKPGITGLWQVSGRREVGFREMVLLDLYYIENQSLLFDLEILFSTIPVVLFGRGAY